MRDLKIDEIKDLLSKEPNEETMNLIKEDTRAGVNKLLQTYYRRLSQEKLLKEKFLEMRDFDLETIDRQNIYFAGIDEVGRGPLAGPVVSAAVILKKDAYILGIDDSKKLTDEKREKLFNEIITSSESIGIGIIDAKTIDKVNIYEATKLAMVQAVNNLSVKPDHLLIDAMKLDVDITCSSIIKGDTKSLSIAAASIVAKVTRDRLMKEYSLKYPEYLFNKNMGYGTKEHLQAIQSFGVLPIHRRTFAPIKDIV